MSRKPVSRSMRPTTRTAVLCAGIAAVAVLAIASGVIGGGTSTIGKVQLVTAAAKSPSTPDAQAFPFGAPGSRPDYSVPQPPGQPTLVATYGTKTTQRLYGADPFQEAVSVTQHVWPASVPLNNPNENNNDPDRP